MLEVKLFHDARIGMISSTMMALVKDHKGIVCQLYVPSSEAV
jgi:hypothetical protein